MNAFLIYLRDHTVTRELAALGTLRAADDRLYTLTTDRTGTEVGAAIAALSKSSPYMVASVESYGAGGDLGFGQALKVLARP